MAPRPAAQDQPEPPLSEEITGQLLAHAIPARDEIGIRRELERHVPGYTLVRLTPAAARKWKARYRIMLSATYIDCQSVAEAYALALLAVLSRADSGASHQAPDSASTDA